MMEVNKLNITQNILPFQALADLIADLIYNPYVLSIEKARVTDLAHKRTRFINSFNKVIVLFPVRNKRQIFIFNSNTQDEYLCSQEAIILTFLTLSVMAKASKCSCWSPPPPPIYTEA